MIHIYIQHKEMPAYSILYTFSLIWIYTLTYTQIHKCKDTCAQQHTVTHNYTRTQVHTRMIERTRTHASKHMHKHTHTQTHSLTHTHPKTQSRPHPHPPTHTLHCVGVAVGMSVSGRVSYSLTRTNKYTHSRTTTHQHHMGWLRLVGSLTL